MKLEGHHVIKPRFSRVLFHCFIFKKIAIEKWWAGEHKLPVPDLLRPVILIDLNHEQNLDLIFSRVEGGFKIPEKSVQLSAKALRMDGVLGEKVTAWGLQATTIMKY